MRGGTGRPAGKASLCTACKHPVDHRDDNLAGIKRTLISVTEGWGVGGGILQELKLLSMAST